MIKQSEKYSNSVVYMIRCKNSNVKEIYIGSTHQFKLRISLHKHFCYNESSKKYNFKVYKFIRDNGGFNNFEFIVLEELNCENKKQLLEKERYYYDIHKPSLNTQMPNRSLLEYKQNPNYRKKMYQDKHKCICGVSHTLANKCNHLRSQNHINFINSMNQNKQNNFIEVIDILDNENIDLIELIEISNENPIQLVKC
jgi:hypothetical protein